jgi:hypothetical protein
MNIHTVLGGNHAFDSDEVAILVLAYENALRELRMAEREDPATLLVAYKILDLAKLGERNPDRLRDANPWRSDCGIGQPGAWSAAWREDSRPAMSRYLSDLGQIRPKWPEIADTLAQLGGG